MKFSRIRSVLSCLIAPVLSLIFAIYYFKIYRLDLNQPVLFGGGDGILPLMLIKNLVTGSSHQVSNYLGAPFQFNFYDFPVSGEAFQIFCFQLLKLINNSTFWIHNVYFFLKFPITAFVAYLVFRDLGIQKSLSISAAFIFSLTPCVFSRGIGHYFLGFIYSVPIGAWYCFLILEQRLPKFSFFSVENGTRKINKRFLCFIIGAFVLAGAGIYYAFYACLFIFFTFIVTLFSSEKKLSKVDYIKSGSPIFLTIGIAAVYSIPNMLYYSEFGKNLLVGHRSAVESDIFGLKAMALFMPVGNHLWSKFREIAGSYSQWPLHNENVFASLGLLGAAGVFLSVIWVFIESAVFSTNEKMKKVYQAFNLTRDEVMRVSLSAKLVVFAIIYASIGGFAFFVSVWFPSIRAQNRISVYIMFFSVFFVASIANILVRRIKMTTIKQAIFLAILLFVSGLAAFDQSGYRPAWQTEPVKSAAQNMKNFVEKIEATISDGDKVMQMPIGGFPEVGPVGRMMHYEHLTAYMYSKKAHWSYGAMSGRSAFKWQSSLIGLPANELVQKIQTRGFKGIYIDRFGYSDDGAALEKELKAFLKEEPIESEDKRYAFYGISKGPYEIQFDDHAFPEKFIVNDAKGIIFESISEHLRVDLLKKYIQNFGSDQFEIDFKKHRDFVNWDAYRAMQNDTINSLVDVSYFDGGLTCVENQKISLQDFKNLESIKIKFRIENGSKFWWFLNGPGKRPIRIRTILYREDLSPVESLPFSYNSQVSVGPGETYEAILVVPKELFWRGMVPEGSVLEIAMLQEGYEWAKNLNANAKRCLMKIQR